jgi:hypothetical protein
MKEGNKKRRGTKMRKAVLGMAIAVIFTLVLSGCGGSGGLKGTVWLGSTGIDYQYTMGFSSPYLTFNAVEFDEKEAKISIRTGDSSYLLAKKEYSVEKGKELIIYKDEMKKVLDVKKKQPAYYDQFIIKGEVDKDTLKIGRVEYKKSTKAEADKILEDLRKQYKEAREELQKEIDAENARYK